MSGSLSSAGQEHAVSGTPDPHVVIEVRSVVKRFGDVRALNGVDLTARKGEVLGLLGPNGKTATSQAPPRTSRTRSEAVWTSEFSNSTCSPRNRRRRRADRSSPRRIS
jgi:ABC-type branched-subunit amino acid transport system ATPase component